MQDFWKEKGGPAPLTPENLNFAACQAGYPYRYFGSQSVMPGQMYMKTMHRITISM